MTPTAYLILAFPLSSPRRVRSDRELVAIARRITERLGGVVQVGRGRGYAKFAQQPRESTAASPRNGVKTPPPGGVGAGAEPENRSKAVLARLRGQRRNPK